MWTYDRLHSRAHREVMKDLCLCTVSNHKINYCYFVQLQTTTKLGHTHTHTHSRSLLGATTMQGFPILLLLILPLMTATHEPRELQSQKAENHHQQGGEASRALQLIVVRDEIDNEDPPHRWDVYFTADFSFTLGRRGGRMCMRRKHDAILAILNKGFNQVVGRSKFAGSISLANQNDDGICDDDNGGRARRLNQDNQLEHDKSGNTQGDVTNETTRGLRRGAAVATSPNNHPNTSTTTTTTTARHLQLRTTFPEYLFHGGFRCRFCNPDVYDTPIEGVEPRPTINQELDMLAVDMSAHLTSAVQLSGMRCVTRGRPSVRVTLRQGGPRETSSTCGNR